MDHDDDLPDGGFGAWYLKLHGSDSDDDDFEPWAPPRSLNSYNDIQRQVIREKCAKLGKEDPWTYTARKAAERQVRERTQINQAEKKEVREANAELPPVKKPSTEFKISLQKARMAAGLKQSELAAKVKVTAKIISDWESGKSLPTGAQRAALNKVLKTVLPKA